jgi:phosphoenolpyruvate carboxylase
MYRQSIQFPVKDAGLREDVHALGELIGQMLRDQGGDALLDMVEGDRRAAIRRREGGADAGEDNLEVRTQSRSPAAATDLTRAFSIWFQAVNTAEKVHRVRRRRQYLNDSTQCSPAALPSALRALRTDGFSLEQTLELIASHEHRAGVRGASHRVHAAHDSAQAAAHRARSLDRLVPGRTHFELETLWARVRLEITSIWQTEDHPREDLTVADEREHVLFYLIEILYRVVPLFYEEIEAALAHAYSVPVDSLDVPSMLRFGSWVGGDMDGNADVHGKTIRETLHRHQQVIVSTYFTECGQLAETLSQSASRITISAALAKRIEAYESPVAGRPGIGAGAARPHAVSHFLRSDRERLQGHLRRPAQCLSNPDELLADVGLAADSLVENRGRHAGYFLVRGSCAAYAPSAFIWRRSTSLSMCTRTMK